MRRLGGRRCLMLGVGLVGGMCHGADRLVIVHDTGGTVSAAPYVERPDLSEERLAKAMTRAWEELADYGEPPSEDTFSVPVDSAPLRVGRPERLRVRGLTGTLFAIGSDEASLDWLEANGAELSERGAVGFLVSARSLEVLVRMRKRAFRFGLTLDPMPGAALAEAFGASSYPFVAEPAR